MPGDITDLIGPMPYRMAFAGGWIDQPFVSRLNPEPPGSMVTVAVEPTFRWMDRCGMATSTRSVALHHWGGRMPAGDPRELVRELYEAENRGKAEPSGSQDMVGLLYPGVCRLDFDASVEGGVFPARVETCADRAVARWLGRVIQVLRLLRALSAMSLSRSGTSIHRGSDGWGSPAWHAGRRFLHVTPRHSASP